MRTERGETAEFILDYSKQLSKVAAAQQMKTLAHLLEMIAEEARLILNEAEIEEREARIEAALKRAIHRPQLSTV